MDDHPPDYPLQTFADDDEKKTSSSDDAGKKATIRGVDSIFWSTQVNTYSSVTPVNNNNTFQPYPPQNYVPQPTTFSPPSNFAASPPPTETPLPTTFIPSPNTSNYVPQSQPTSYVPQQPPSSTPSTNYVPQSQPTSYVPQQPPSSTYAPQPPSGGTSPSAIVSVPLNTAVPHGASASTVVFQNNSVPNLTPVFADADSNNLFGFLDEKLQSGVAQIELGVRTSCQTVVQNLQDARSSAELLQGINSCTV